MTDYNDGNWHGWQDQEDDMHPIEIHALSVVEWFSSEDGSTGMDIAGNLDWSDGGAFRVIKEHKRPRGFWVKESVCHHNKSSIPPWENLSDWIHVREVLE